MDPTTGLTIMSLLGLVGMGLMFAFILVCDRI